MRPAITEVLPGQPWSICSRRDIERFFQQNLQHCLANRPRRSKHPYPRELPGEFYTADEQCEMLLGRGSRACKIPVLQTCQQLWCEKVVEGKKTCITRSVKRADGTPCGDGMKCYSGTCLHSSRRPVPVDGGWSSWGEYGTCSRTCGGGIMISRRECSRPTPQNGGRFCIGDKTRVASCNTDDCPDDTDFRAQQCANFNGKRPRSLMNADVDKSPVWVPKYSGLNDRDRCKLVCSDIHTHTYVTWEYAVIDGTRCSDKTTDICVQGQCMPAGCDHRLGSKLKYNKCGVCGGSRKSCKKVKAKYNDRRNGYNDVITFPVGANRISVTQKSSSQDHYDGNYLVLLDDHDNYMVNGQMYLMIDSKDIQYGGTTIKYSGVGQRTESIITETPLKRALKLQVLTNRNNKSPLSSPRIKIQYYITRTKKSKKSKKNKNRTRLRVSKTDLTPRRAAPVRQPAPQSSPQNPLSSSSSQGRWVTGRWRKCKVFGSETCGKGQMKRIVTCKDGKSASSNCSPRDKPRNRQNCMVKCPRNSRGAPSRPTPPPPRQRVQSNRVEAGRWRYGHWSECSTSCGLGFKKRQVKCLTSSGKELSDSTCNPDLRPSDTHGCRNSDCRS